ncbi:MAG: bifunctional folylpolyglutamate synthase/dihydrofolate synthase [bacterium]|nr:bifunctional folylpolyglutamate synthase/dihydrofolate synthase [bacterium]
MTIERLNKFINNEKRTIYKDYTLDAVTSLLNISGNPHLRVPAIHIAGTNGKGSVAHMLNSICIESGYRTGLFTSPHLLNLNERIKINNRDIENRSLDRYINEILNHPAPGKTESPTFFDIITLIAFRYFYDNNVDIAIIETGLGGRLDSTNVITPLCSIITAISMDHTAILGSTLPEIAGEKAGIIKQGVPVITTGQEAPIRDVLISRAAQENAPLLIHGRDFSATNRKKTKNRIIPGTVFDYELRPEEESLSRTIPGIEINQPGSFQAENASLAITAACIIRNSFTGITPASIKQGLAQTTIPGRFQVLHNKPLLIFDPAHNISAVLAAMEILEDIPAQPRVIILTLMQDKEYEKIITRFEKSGAELIYYEAGEERGLRVTGTSLENRFFAVLRNKQELYRVLDTFSFSGLFFFTGSFRLYTIAVDYSNRI